MDEYAGIAPFYEKLLGKALGPMRGAVCAFVHEHDHRRIIDVCCGTGALLAMLDRADRSLIGVDVSAAMLEQAPPASTVSYLQADAATLDFPSHSFDAVILTFSLHEKKNVDRDALLQLSWNLVRRGGHLLVGDYCRIPRTWRGALWGNMLIPLLERAAGSEHHGNYRSWMRNGALEGHLHKVAARQRLVSRHFGGTVALMSLVRE